MTNLSFILARRRCSAFVCLLATIALSLRSSHADSGCDTGGGSTCQNGQCGLAGGSSASTCLCCPQTNGANVSCANYFSAPSSSCGESFEPISYPDYTGYEKTVDFNCGWSSTACLQDNLDGKFVCPQGTLGAAPGRFCNNTHAGYDIGETFDVQECIDICNANPKKCGGFAFFPNDSLGSNCIDHGSDDQNSDAKKGAGACYFRKPSWVNEGFPKPGVTCYKNKSTTKPHPP